MEEKKACMQTALRSLTRKMSSEKEMLEKLQKRNYSQESIDATISDLKRLRYLDDTRLIDALCEEYFTFKKYGPIRVKQTLFKKKFAAQLIDETLLQHDDPRRDQRHALYWGEKKMQRLAQKELPAQVRSLQQHLYTKGFRPDTIRKVVQTLIFDKQQDFE
jgi:regulatory protein